MNRAAVLRGYYAATLVFVLLDYVFDVNVRLSFLDAWPAARILYYLLCFACFAIIAWHPAWSLLVGTLESLLALSLLIITMGVRVMTVERCAIDRRRGPGHARRDSELRHRGRRRVDLVGARPVCAAPGRRSPQVTASAGIVRRKASNTPKTAGSSQNLRPFRDSNPSKLRFRYAAANLYSRR